ELLAPREGERQRIVVVGGGKGLRHGLEDVGQRRGGEDRHLMAATAAARAGSGESDGSEGKGAQPPHRSAGSSTTTLVALTAATASTPGASFNSSAASRVIRETTRWRPAWISTWAATLSLTTRVTTPVNRLRVDWPTMA